MPKKETITASATRSSPGCWLGRYRGWVRVAIQGGGVVKQARSMNGDTRSMNNTCCCTLDACLEDRAHSRRFFSSVYLINIHGPQRVEEGKMAYLVDSER